MPTIKRSADNKDQQSTSTIIFTKYGYAPNYFGSSRCDGNRYVAIFGTASVEQTLTFPEAGVYRLEFYAASRYNPHVNCGHNPLKASFAAVGSGTTNEICTVRVDSLDFLRHEALFRIPAAGQYALRIEGVTADANSDRMSRLDKVSVRKSGAFGADAPAIGKDTVIDVADGAKLRLDFPGTLKLGGVRYAGRMYLGTLASDTCPFLLGPGTIRTPGGFSLSFK